MAAQPSEHHQLDVKPREEDNTHRENSVSQVSGMSFIVMNSPNRKGSHPEDIHAYPSPIASAESKTEERPAESPFMKTGSRLDQMLRKNDSGSRSGSLKRGSLEVPTPVVLMSTQSVQKQDTMEYDENDDSVEMKKDRSYGLYQIQPFDSKISLNLGASTPKGPSRPLSPKDQLDLEEGRAVVTESGTVMKKKKTAGSAYSASPKTDEGGQIRTKSGKTRLETVVDAARMKDKASKRRLRITLCGLAAITCLLLGGIATYFGVFYGTDSSSNSINNLSPIMSASNGTVAPTSSPTSYPTSAPTTITSTTAPSVSPTGAPTSAPTAVDSPTNAPTSAPTAVDSPTSAPTEAPSTSPTSTPTDQPTSSPTSTPTSEPTAAPTETPTEAPTAAPTDAPTVAPTAAPTDAPTEQPTEAPTAQPTEAPTEAAN